MLKRYKYRAYPTLSQTTHFARTFGSARVVYNKYVETNKEGSKLTSYGEACKKLTALKKMPGYEWLGDVSSIALQQSLKDATQGVNNFFLALAKNKGSKKNSVRPPTFKKRSSRQAYRIVGANSYRVEKLNHKWGSVVLPKLSTPLRFRQERELPSTPTSVTVIRESDGKYYVSFVVEVETRPLPVVDRHAGIDVGLTTLLTIVDTDGNTASVGNPRYYRRAELDLKHAQQSYSRKQKGSKNQEKARIALARKHSKIANQRKDHINKLVMGLVRENQTISLETLLIPNMVKNRKLAKSIMDASWGLFKTSLVNKSTEHGRKVVFIDQYWPSTQTCSTCKVKRKVKLTLGQREWDCEHCGAHHDRDVNAALNILRVGLGLSFTTVITTAGRVGLACGGDVRRSDTQSPVKQENRNLSLANTRV